MPKNLPNLTPRLALVASFVNGAETVADIGTDHAYIPVYLVNSGLVKNAIASDIVEGPLERAKLTAKTFNAEDKVRFVLADGLNGVKENEADEIVIAGMGGELIAKILEECKWSKSKDKHYVLQPMTAQEDLRKYLFENGFKIEKEAVASEKHGRKLYDVMSVRFCGEKTDFNEVSLYAGDLSKNTDKNSKNYLKHIADSILHHAEGLENAKHEDVNEIKHLKTLANDILLICDKISERMETI